MLEEGLIVNKNTETKAILLVLDGAGDRQCEKWPKTPLQKARTPNLDKLAGKGMTGLLDPLSPGVRPGSGNAHLALFGYPPERFYKGRGVLSAFGAGIKLEKGEVAFRVNFATLKNGKIADRRAGRLNEMEGKKLCKALEKVEVKKAKARFGYVKEYRGVLLLKGERLGEKVEDTDPKEENSAPLKAKGKDSASKKTAALANEFISKAQKVLEEHPLNAERKKKGKPEANFILLRGASSFSSAPSFEERYGLRAVCLADYPLYNGVARFVGMELAEYNKKPYNYPDLKVFEENLKSKFKKAVELLKEKDFVFVHVKETDEAGEDGDYKLKAKFFEAIDRCIPVLAKGNHFLVVTADHSTPCCVKGHSGDPVPILISGPEVRANGTKGFNEISVSKGTMGRIYSIDLMTVLLDLMNRLKRFGA